MQNLTEATPPQHTNVLLDSQLHTETIKAPSDLRSELELAYIELAVEFVELSTDDFHSYDENTVRDPRFLIAHEINFYPRFCSLSERETESAKQIKATASELETKLLLAQLGLLASAHVTAQDIHVERANIALRSVYADLLRTAGVLTNGVFTNQLDPTELEGLQTSFGDRFKPEFIAILNENDIITPTQQSVKTLQLVA